MNLTMGAWGRLHQLWERPLGPLFEKELRVVSRRKGWYALRTAYVSLLLVLVVVTWGIAMARASGGSQTLAMTPRMSQAGQSLVMTLVWFQFLSMQLLAVGIMSTAVSEEARGQTLSVLFTTPITGGQFILGKLASRMLQLVLLMAMGLPMLGLLRVYGGIDWPFVVRGFAITAGADTFRRGNEPASIRLVQKTPRRHRIESAGTGRGLRRDGVRPVFRSDPALHSEPLCAAG